MLVTGMGNVPLTWQEIDSWVRTTEQDLTVWEKLIIKEMSEAYVAESQQAKGRNAASPFVAPVNPETIDRAAVASKLRSVLSGFKRKKSAT